MGNEDRKHPPAYTYAQEVLALLDSGELRVGYDATGNALLFYTPEGDAERATPVAMLLPIDPVATMTQEPAVA